MGSVVATCCGQRHNPNDVSLEDSDLDTVDRTKETSLKVWSMPFPDPIAEAEDNGSKLVE